MDACVEGGSDAALSNPYRYGRLKTQVAIASQSPSRDGCVHPKYQPPAVPMRSETPSMTLSRTIFEESHELVRKLARSFAERELVPHRDRWEEAGIVDRSLFENAGSVGLLGTAAPVAFGGGGEPDFRYNAVRIEEFTRAGVLTPGQGIDMHVDVALPYFLKFTTDDQKRRWLPGLCSGELIAAVAMTEPGAGSDLAGLSTRAVRDGDEYVLNGAKTFISN